MAQSSATVATEPELDHMLNMWLEEQAQPDETSDNDNQEEEDEEEGKVLKQEPLEGRALLPLKTLMTDNKVTSAKKLLQNQAAADAVIAIVGGYVTITGRGSEENEKGAKWYRSFFEKVVRPALKKSDVLRKALDPFHVMVCNPLPPTYPADLAACPPRSAVNLHGIAPAALAPMVGGQINLYAFLHNAVGVRAAFFWMGCMRGRDPNYEFLTINTQTPFFHY